MSVESQTNFFLNRVVCFFARNASGEKWKRIRIFQNAFIQCLTALAFITLQSLTHANAGHRQHGGDTSPPTVPTNLFASAPTASKVDLSWTASADNVGVAKYLVFRNGATTSIGSATGVSYSDTTLAPSTAYSYTVKAVDAAGNTSAASNTATITTPALADTSPPTAPASLLASAASATQVNLSWSASTDNVGVANYRIFRNGGATPIGTATAVSYSDKAVVANTMYSYTVNAIDSSGNVSVASNAAAVNTPPLPDTVPPTTPAGLSAVASAATQVNLSWTASTDNVAVANYLIYRNGGATSIGSATGSSYSDSTAVSNTAYSYTVKAVDTSGNVSAASNAATVNTPSAVTQSSYDIAVLADKPVMYLAMNSGQSGAERDMSGLGHTGTYSASYISAPAITHMPNNDVAAQFDGLSQYLEIPDADALSVITTGVISLEGWMRPDTLEFPTSESTGYVHWMGKGVSGQQEYAARMYSYTNTESPPRPNRISGYAFNLSGGLGTGSYFQDAVTAGQWIHVALVINTKNTSTNFPTGYTKIFKNGVLRDMDALKDYNIIPANGTAPYRVGTQSLASYFKGAIGKVAVYNYEPSPEQIMSHYNVMCGSGC